MSCSQMHRSAAAFFSTIFKPSITPTATTGSRFNHDGSVLVLAGRDLQWQKLLPGLNLAFFPQALGWLEGRMGVHAAGGYRLACGWLGVASPSLPSAPAPGGSSPVSSVDVQSWMFDVWPMTERALAVGGNFAPAKAPVSPQ